jgi:hypothetical protein
MTISSMKRLNSKEIKKALLGIVLSDGTIRHRRFSAYFKYEEMAKHVNEILSNISGLTVTTLKTVDTRFNPPAIGYKTWTTKHPYLEKIEKLFYPDGEEKGEKRITKYIADRLDVISFSYIWMCDGYLGHQKNRAKNKIQNQGWFCLEGYPPEDLELLIFSLKKLDIESRLSPVEWGHKFRILVSAHDLQKFISLIYPFVLDIYKYKTTLYYKTLDYTIDVPNAEHIFKMYENVEDIVRHS